MQLLHKQIKLDKIEIKADESGARTIEGWASTFGNVDSDDDIIVPGAFADSIKARMPKMLWQHNTDQPSGVWTEAQETAQGLYVKGTILDTTLGNDVYKLAQAGAIDSMSIGYVATKYVIDESTWTRTLQAIDLWEVSLVTFPANDQARITSVKSKPTSERELEKLLRDAGGYSRSEAKGLIAGGYKAIAPQRDADEQALITLAKRIDAFTSLLSNPTV
jgi:HK97 family phage prohead protease